jgi:hypothetical protein
LVLLFLWLFTPRVDAAFDGGFLLPLLGFLFLPFTTMAYVFAWSPVDGISGGGWILVIGGLLFDAGTYAISGYLNRHRLPSSAGG